MIVTIDGPAGSGKSTAARKLAARLEVPYLDTGAMYRALAYAGWQRGIDFSDEQAVVELAKSVQIELDCGPTFARVRVDGHDVSEAIRTMAVSRRHLEGGRQSGGPTDSRAGATADRVLSRLVCHRRGAIRAASFSPTPT